MRRLGLWVAGLVLAGGILAEAGLVRVLVADLPYARVWAAAVRAVEGYPLERARDGLILTQRVERPPRADEAGFERIAERITLRVEAFGVRSTRVTVEVEAEGRRHDAWVPISETGGTAREIVARLRAAEG